MSVMARITSSGDEPAGGGALERSGLKSVPAAKLGLWVFMGVVTTLFALLISAYHMRMEYVDWHPLPEPWQLWLNTAFLMLSSAALQWARVAARRGRMAGLKAGLLAGGV
ncbi:MAG TPA: hypothetical protein VNN09_06615, partial [Candidatus Competibacteraceae bacterium]|nr:hypothetical protein [Candidatus Competibacteraceae bacterium]